MKTLSEILANLKYKDVPVLIDQYGGTNIEQRLDISNLQSELEALIERVFKERCLYKYKTVISGENESVDKLYEQNKHKYI